MMDTIAVETVCDFLQVRLYENRVLLLPLGVRIEGGHWVLLCQCRDHLWTHATEPYPLLYICPHLYCS